MRIVVTTIYEPVDEEFLEFYLTRLEQGGQMIQATELKRYGHTSLKSKDPTGSTWAETTTKVVKD